MGQGSSGLNYQGGSGNVTSYGDVMYGGGGGSGGGAGVNGIAPTFSGGYSGLSAGKNGGSYGGGGGGCAPSYGSCGSSNGMGGAVRILWGPAGTRIYPSTGTGNL